MSYKSSTNFSCHVGSLQPDLDVHGSSMYQSCCLRSPNTKRRTRSQDLEENRCSVAQSASESSTSVVEQVRSPVDETGVTSSSAICPAPICRQFWKAGNYDDRFSSKATHSNGKNYLHVHPMFLHSNATSHQWTFGAVAELLDNAVDEIQNGATFVIVDKTTNPRDGTAALLIQDDGGGMDPQAIRHCMGFGFSDKKSKSTIGKYGNGFKTSTMRLGADAIVFSRHMKDKMWTQSIGLLSYTFLTRTGHDRIVVPIVDYEFHTSTGAFKVLQDRGHFTSNLSILLQWSPFSTEAELLQQFDNIGTHGTKVIIYNLWFNDDAKLELDFDSDAQDILIEGFKKFQTLPGWRSVNEQHIGKRFSYSLRVYLSILYLRLPGNFKLVLRGQALEHHNIADDLMYPEYILYRPQTGECEEAKVVTTIGFLKEAPQVNIHGFCVYHKNRLIMPFWKVLTSTINRGRGVVGVLEANFVEPTHNKQSFERTSLLQKLENRLKEMTWEYWDLHCELIGYKATKKPPVQVPQRLPPDNRMNVNTYGSNSATGFGKRAGTAPPGFLQAMASGISTPTSEAAVQQVLCAEREQLPDLVEFTGSERQAGTGASEQNFAVQKPFCTSAIQSNHPECVSLMEANKKLRTKCLEHKERIKILDLKALMLRSELGNVKREYERLMAEL